MCYFLKEENIGKHYFYVKYMEIAKNYPYRYIVYMDDIYINDDNYRDLEYIYYPKGVLHCSRVNLAKCCSSVFKVRA